MIVVTGATGHIGSEVVRLLLAGGQRVRVLVRDASKVKALEGRVEVSRGDLLQPQTLTGAFAGAEKAFILVASIEQLPTAAAPLFTAAERAGVKHVVFISSATIDIEPRVTVGGWHLAAETALKATSLAWTMLRPGNFASNSVRWAPTIKSQGAVFATHASHKSAVVDPLDIAAVAAKALTSDGHAGKTYTVTGPELLTASEQVETLSKALGRPVRFVEVPEAGARMGMVKGGMTEQMAEAVLELQRPGRSAATLSTAVKDVTGATPRSYAQWVQANVDAFS